MSFVLFQRANMIDFDPLSHDDEIQANNIVAVSIEKGTNHHEHAVIISSVDTLIAKLSATQLQLTPSHYLTTRQCDVTSHGRGSHCPGTQERR